MQCRGLREEHPATAAADYHGANEGSARSPWIVRDSKEGRHVALFGFLIGTFVGPDNEPVELAGVQYRIQDFNAASPHRLRIPRRCFPCR